MARYETYQSNAAEAPLMRKWIFRGLIASLIIHAGLFVFFQTKQLENFGMQSVERLTPSRFVLKQVTIDPKTLQDPDEVKTTLKEKPKALPKIAVPVEKIGPSEISVTPQNTEIVSPILNDKPNMAAVNKDLLAKVEANSAGAMDKELGSIANSLLTDSTRAPKQPVVFTLPKGAKDAAGGVGVWECLVPAAEPAAPAAAPVPAAAAWALSGRPPGRQDLPFERRSSRAGSRPGQPGFATRDRCPSGHSRRPREPPLFPVEIINQEISSFHTYEALLQFASAVTGTPGATASTSGISWT